MRIGVAGPATMEPLSGWLSPDVELPPTYSFPYISQLVSAYLEAGHEVDLYTSSLQVDHLRVYGDGPLRIYVGRRREKARARGLDFFRIERDDIRTAITVSQPDVVHAHWLYEFASAALDVRPDALVTAHDSPVALVRHYHHPYWLLRAALGVRTLARTKNMTVVSPSLMGETKFPRPRERSVHVVPNGISLSSLGRASDHRVSGKGAAVVATIANGFDKRKNTSTALEAFGLFRLKDRNARLLMFGRDHQPGGPAHQWAVSKGLTQGVDFVGEASHENLMERLDSEVDVLLHTSRWEACSIAVLECLAAGIPVIGGRRSGGMPHMLTAGAGVLVDVTDPRKVSNALTHITSSAEAFDEYASRARDLVATKFAFEAVISDYLQILGRISADRPLVPQPNSPVVRKADITVLIASHNRADKTSACIETLFRSAKVAGVSIRVVVADAGSMDGTPDRLAAFENVDCFDVGTATYWAGAMRQAWLRAKDDGSDYVLWLNDDVELLESALSTLMTTVKQMSNLAVVVGACRGSDRSHTTYSGLRSTSRLNKLKLETVYDNYRPIPCDTFNGNVVLIPRQIDLMVGGFPEKYTHSMADMAYGFELTRRGMNAVVAPAYVGICDRNKVEGTWGDPALPPTKRIELLRAPKGLPFTEWLLLCVRYGGPTGLGTAAKPYARVYASHVVWAFRRFKQRQSTNMPKSNPLGNGGAACKKVDE